MIPYHQLHKPSDTETAMRGDYDGQGKSAQRETDDSMTMLLLIAAYVGLIVTIALLSMPWWWQL